MCAHCESGWYDMDADDNNARWMGSLSIHLSVCFCVDGENRTTCFTILPTLFWQRATGVNGALCVRVYGKTSILFSMSPFANFRMGFVCTPFSKRNFSSFVMLSFCPHRITGVIHKEVANNSEWKIWNWVEKAAVLLSVWQNWTTLTMDLTIQIESIASLFVSIISFDSVLFWLLVAG